MPCVQKSTKCFGNLTHSSKYSKQYIPPFPPCHKYFPDQSNFFSLWLCETTGLQQKQKSISEFNRLPNVRSIREGGKNGWKKGPGWRRNFGRGCLTSGSCWRYLEPLELLLALHGHGWGRGVRVALHHLAAVGLHGRGVVVAAMHGGDGRPMAARALRHGRHLPRQTARQARPRDTEQRASPAPQTQQYSQGSRTQLVWALTTTANNFTQATPDNSHPILQIQESPPCRHIPNTGCPQPARSLAAQYVLWHKDLEKEGKMEFLIWQESRFSPFPTCDK